MSVGVRRRSMFTHVGIGIELGILDDGGVRSLDDGTYGDLGTVWKCDRCDDLARKAD